MAKDEEEDHKKEEVIGVDKEEEIRLTTLISNIEEEGVLREDTTLLGEEEEIKRCLQYTRGEEAEARVEEGTNIAKTL